MFVNDHDEKSQEPPNLFVKFCEYTTIHGFRQLSSSSSSIVERLFWAVFIALAIFGSYQLSSINIARYEASPSVVSLQKDFRNWQFPFPAMTFCLVDKVDRDATKIYFRSKHNATMTDEQSAVYVNFTQQLGNMRLDNVLDFDWFRDKVPRDLDVVDLLTYVLPKFTPNIQPSDKQTREIIPHMTEMGMCFAYNSYVVHFLQGQATVNESVARGQVMRCLYLNFQCYTRLETRYTPTWTAQLYIHSPYETVDVRSTNPTILTQDENTDENYDLLETISTVDLRTKLTPKQRKCRFLEEHGAFTRHIYTFTTCQMTCRRNFIVDKCACTPFFYFYMGGKMCNLDGLACMHRIRGEIMTLRCNCPQPCDDVFYKRQNIKVKQQAGAYLKGRISYRLGLLPARMRLQRNIIFSFEDLIASFGGVAGLFLGISFLTIVELFYFIFDIALARFNLEADTKLKRMN